MVLGVHSLGTDVPMHGTSRLAQLVERKTLNLVVVGSSPTVGAFFVPFFLTGPVRTTSKALRVGIHNETGGVGRVSWSPSCTTDASIAQLAEHSLSKRKVTSSNLVGGLSALV